MNRTHLALVGPFALVSLVFASGCSSSLAQPFQQMKDANAPITVLRLQNYEPPAAQAQAPTAQFQLPPEIAQWAQQAAALLPPGLLPPGMVPGAPAPTPTAAQENRFHGFRVLGVQQINNQKLHDEVLDIVGHDKNFVAQHDGCMYAEFGISVAAPNGGQPGDMLVSLSCDQVQSPSFQWPYANNGIPQDTAKRLAAAMTGAFSGGT